MNSGPQDAAEGGRLSEGSARRHTCWRLPAHAGARRSSPALAGARQRSPAHAGARWRSPALAALAACAGWSLLQTSVTPDHLILSQSSAHHWKVLAELSPTGTTVKRICNDLWPCRRVENSKKQALWRTRRAPALATTLQHCSVLTAAHHCSLAANNMYLGCHLTTFIVSDSHPPLTHSVLCVLRHPASRKPCPLSIQSV